MPIQVETPDGNIAEFPDGMDKAKIEAVLKKQYPKTQKPNALIDSIRSIPGGLAQGAAGLAGFPGDIESGLNVGADWIMEKLGADPQRIQDIRKYREENRPLQLPTSEGINKTISTPFGGYYQPQTPEGKQTESVARFALMALSPGRAIERIGRAVFPGVLSEDARAAVEKTRFAPLAPLAAAGGALIGGGGMSLAEGLKAARAAPKALSMKQLGDAKTALYETARQKGVVIAAPAWKKFAEDVTEKLNKKPFRSDLHPNALSALKTLSDETGDVTLENADAIRQVIDDAIEAASKNTNKGDYARSTEIKSMLDNFLDNLEKSPNTTLSGDPAIAVPILKEARGLAQREFKAKQIQKLIDLAENQAGANYSASGVGQALRTQFKNLNADLIKNPNLAKSFSKEERDAIVKVVQGGPLENALRLIGKLAPTNNISMGVGPSLGAAAGSMFGGPVGAGVGAVAVPAVGAGARLGATAITSRNARLAEELMRRGMPIANPRTSAAQIANLLLSQQANRPNYEEIKE
jgi:hypothetical protein